MALRESPWTLGPELRDGHSVRSAMSRWPEQMRTGPSLESRPKAPRVWILTHGSGSRKRVLDQQPVRQVGRRGPSEPLPEG